MASVTTAPPAPSARREGSTASRSVNDLAIRVGTVNGSGSQSSNLVLLRALNHMGIPCSGKNIFPSNIEGLPTWFHLRASARGYVAHRQDVSILVCMNEQTAADDIRRVAPGAVVIYRDDFKEDVSGLRDDVRMIAVPFQKLVEEAYPNDGTKSYRETLRKVINMVYVGVVAYVTGIELEAVEHGIRREFPGRKAKAGEVNIRAAQAGFGWAAEHLGSEPFACRVERMDATLGQILVDGNRASALGAVFGGASVMTWYPITPSSSLAEAAEEYFKRTRENGDGRKTFAVVQAEDELAAIGMAVGAGWAGARAITATSGPGISLMTEFVGLAYFAEIPVTIIDVQRMGPSTGLPTRTSQGDILKLHLLGHGDCRHPVLIPGSVKECFELTGEAIDLAQRFQTPVFVATDLDLGMNLWLSEPFPYPTRPLQRGKVLDAVDLQRRGGFGRYRDVDGDGVCYRTLPGTEHPAAAYFTRGTGHNESSGYSERPEDWRRNLDRLTRKLETARAELPRPVIAIEPGAKVGLIAYGSTDPAAIEARDLLRAAGVPVSYCRIRALPAADSVAEFVSKCDRVYVIEQNRDGQLCMLLRATLEGSLDDRLFSITHYNGIPIAAGDIVGPVLDWERNFQEHHIPSAQPSPPDPRGNGEGPVVSTE
ncbi:2-oxoacid:acceptor oxidoreductase subunit alpha [Tautonia sociabilis]|uniref:2-oxoacid:acceptor oxidoreductase subunit alpha n=1 Tax=Tautonia sociabilis TaxID=2080755 RepID=A0A432MP28_9BACT|nr:2-oxoacid:acceptor oxidoreductase subunit alpha [Tautonia sociabilis]RUL89162.1 2-oxoacid:acceptor oxidoreductase subunit alpha [Tautonia sociabilis]